MQVDLQEAEMNFSKLLIQAGKGEEITITRSGKPIAKLVALEKPKKARKPGSAKGQIVMSDDFDAALPDDVLASFYK